MDLRQLEAVREVVAAGSVTGAAAALHCTPSAVSQQLRIAERLAGTALVERDGRGIRITAAGRALAARAVEVAVALERARAAIDELAERPTGTVTVSAFQSAAEMMFPRLLHAMREHDGIAVECVEADVAQEQFPAIAARADVVIAHRPDRSATFATAELQATRLLREPLDIALAPANPLSRRAELWPVDLVGQEWITVHDPYPLAAVVAELEIRSGATFTIAHRINDFHVAQAMVAAGHGIALLPRYAATLTPNPGFVLRPLRGLRAGRIIEALVRADRAERRIVTIVVAELRRQALAIQRG